MFRERIQKWATGSLGRVQGFVAGLKRPAIFTGAWHKASLQKIHNFLGHHLQKAWTF
jgi:hypothetical protein